jgi:hypothetical protein
MFGVAEAGVIEPTIDEVHENPPEPVWRELSAANTSTNLTTSEGTQITDITIEDLSDRFRMQPRRGIGPSGCPAYTHGSS